MSKILQSKLESWVVAASAKLIDDGITQDIHIDDLYEGDFEKLTNREVFECAYSIFISLIKFIEEYETGTSGFKFFLMINLIGESIHFAGKPISIENLVELIDRFSVPEIILYRELNSDETYYTEFYRVPIFVDFFKEPKKVGLIYKEFRSLEDMNDNNEYTREINFVYLP